MILFLLLPIGPKGDHLLLLFISEMTSSETETLEEGYFLGSLLKEWFLVVTSCQFVTRNSTIQMMNVMIADISREPMQPSREVIKRTSQNCGTNIFSLILKRFVTPFVLMLNIEKPNSYRPECNQDR